MEHRLAKGPGVVIYCARGGSVSNKILDHLRDKAVQARYREGGIEAWKAVNNETHKKIIR